MKLIRTLAFSAAAVAASVAIAAAQSGPVASDCKSDIAKLCAGRTHDGDVRACLESNYDAVSAACKKALDTTGGGRGRSMGR